MKNKKGKTSLANIVGEAIRKVTESRDLTVDEADQAFTTLFEKDIESYFFFAFTDPSLPFMIWVQTAILIFFLVAFMWFYWDQEWAK